jgi:hypothetical protein
MACKRKAASFPGKPVFDKLRLTVNEVRADNSRIKKIQNSPLLLIGCFVKNGKEQWC